MGRNEGLRHAALSGEPAVKLQGGELAGESGCFTQDELKSADMPLWRDICTFNAAKQFARLTMHRACDIFCALVSDAFHLGPITSHLEPLPMNASLKNFRTLSALALVAALAACGGGGGGGGDSTTPPGGGTTPPADVVSSTGTLKATAGTATYTANSLESDAFAAINQVRGGAGAGYVSQSAQVDVAAAAHAKYLTTNLASGIGHTEDSSKADFYEVSPSSRIAKAGFSAGYTTEVIGGTGASMLGSDCVLGLMNTVYHAAAILSPTTNVGVGFGLDGANIPMCVVDFASAASESYVQVAPAGALVAYPYAGQTNLLETFYVGYESPRPSATLFPNTTAGTPVIVNVRNADFVNFKAAGTLAAVVTKFEMKDSGGNLVPAGILANSGITGSGVTLTPDANLGEGFAVLVPLAPLTKGATYTVTFTATLKTGGAPLTKTWSFTTNP